MHTHLGHSGADACSALHAPVARGYGVAQAPCDGVLVHSTQDVDVPACSAISDKHSHQDTLQAENPLQLTQT